MLPGVYAPDRVFTVTRPLLPELLFEPRAQFTFSNCWNKSQNII
jgi:hypothetical protein